MHVIELRSAAQGHPSYRRVAQAMHRMIAEQAGHRMIAGAMTFVDHDDDALGRLAAEERAERRRSAGAAGGAKGRLRDSAEPLDADRASGLH